MLNEKMSTRLKLMNETLLITKKLLDKMGIRFYLMAGTLLGVIREGHLLPWDNDIDIGMFSNYEDKELRERIVEEFAKEGFRKIFIKGPDNHNCYCISCNGRIPVVSLLNVKELEDSVKVATVPIFWDKKFFNDMPTVEYLGQKFLIPNEVEEYLTVNFGKTWKTRALRMKIVPDSNPIELYEPLPYHKVYLKCDKDGKLIKPYESIGLQKD